MAAQMGAPFVRFTTKAAKKTATPSRGPKSRRKKKAIPEGGQMRLANPPTASNRSPIFAVPK